MKNANPVSRVLALGAAAMLALAACGRSAAETASGIPPLPADGAGPAVHYTYEVIRSWPHDRGAFTQGLLVRNGNLLESTGLNGRSSLREVELTVIGDRAYQLTWQSQRGFVYDADTFRMLDTFTYEGEGWGLATDGRQLVLSDGTSRIRFLDPATFKVVRTIAVTLDGKPLDRLNELEWINGEIFANVWQTDNVVRIDPETGKVRGVIDFTGLLPNAERAPDTDVLNGIAFDAANGRLLVTGKQWPRLYEVRLKPRP